MPNSFFGITIGKTGLYASSAAINTTAHNAANATTEGYSRQLVTTKAATPIPMYSKAGMQGTGVWVQSIERQRNEYYDEKYRASNAVYGVYNTKSYYLGLVENYFSEVNTDSKGLTATLSSFYTNLENLKNNPSDSTTRTAAVEYASNMTEHINFLANSMQKIQKEANTDIKTTVDRINSIAAQVSTLNKQINTLELQSGIANDLRDARDLLIDELSEYCNISVTETDRGDSTTSLHEYVVMVDGTTLVDSYIYNTLVITAEEGNVNQCDIPNLYNVRWSNGETFDGYSPSLGGKLQGLFQVRDGNNGEYFSGKIKELADNDEGVLTLTVVDTNCNNVSKLNLPEEDGKLTVGAKTYYYKTFSVKVDEEGQYEYQFEGITTEDGYELASDDTLYDREGKKVSVGSDVDYKGVPYYQAMLNEYVRTYSSAINAIHNQGQDLNGDQGVDLFTAKNAATGEEYELYEKFEGFSATGNAYYFDEESNEYNTGASYYRMTALNYVVNKNIKFNVQKIATASNIADGVEATDILDQIIKTGTDTTMFNQGRPAQFLETFTANVGTDTAQAMLFTKSQANIIASIDNQRMSVSSVDNDEEAMNLVKYQNAYEVSAKVVSTMQQIYDVLLSMV